MDSQNYQLHFGANRLGRFIAVVLGLAAGIALVIVVQHYVNQISVTLNPSPNTTIGVANPQAPTDNPMKLSYIVRATKRETIHLQKGTYEAVFYSQLATLVPSYQTKRLEDSQTIDTPVLPYTNEKLRSILSVESVAIHESMATIPGISKLLGEGYQFSNESLYDTGEWYSAVLEPANPMVEDVQLIILHKAVNGWSLAAGPGLVFYTGNFSSIPYSVLDAANQSLFYSPPPTATSNTVLQETKEYVTARENSISAAQSSPSSWISSVQNIITPSLFGQLQANAASTSDYITAHTNNYAIRIALNSCTWANASQTETCQLTDYPVLQNTNSVVPASDLPYGWAHTGQQPAVQLTFVNQNGAWLIQSDNSGDY